MYVSFFPVLVCFCVTVLPFIAHVCLLFLNSNLFYRLLTQISYFKIVNLDSVRFLAQQFPAFVSKKTYLFVFVFTAVSRSKMQISNLFFYFVVKCKENCPNEGVNTQLQSTSALGNYANFDTFL